MRVWTLSWGIIQLKMRLNAYIAYDLKLAHDYGGRRSPKAVARLKIVFPSFIFWSHIRHGKLPTRCKSYDRCVERISKWFLYSMPYGTAKFQINVSQSILLSGNLFILWRRCRSGKISSFAVRQGVRHLRQCCTAHNLLYGISINPP